MKLSILFVFALFMLNQLAHADYKFKTMTCAGTIEKPVWRSNKNHIAFKATYLTGTSQPTLQWQSSSGESVQVALARVNAENYNGDSWYSYDLLDYTPREIISLRGQLRLKLKNVGAKVDTFEGVYFVYTSAYEAGNPDVWFNMTCKVNR